MYGLEAIRFEVLEHCDKEKLKEREQSYIDFIKPTFNTLPCADSCRGMRYSKETREKVRAAATNISDETRRKRSEAAKRQWADPEKRARTVNAITEAGNRPETRAKIRAVQANRAPISDETRKRMSESAKNRRKNESA
jgi:hypothetical protein